MTTYEKLMLILTAWIAFGWTIVLGTHLREMWKDRQRNKLYAAREKSYGQKAKK